MNKIIALGDGNAAPEGFRGAELAEIARTVLREHADEALQYGGRPGYLPLRRRVASWLNAEAPSVNVDDLNIVTGAKQALDMAARALARPGDEVLLSQPTYMNALRIFGRAGVRPLVVSSDERGTCVEQIDQLLEDRARRGDRTPRLIYEIPDFHNPTGAVLSEERREQLVKLAMRYDIPILEDNPYRWLRYEGLPARPLRAFDKTGVVISVGTFAKILGPGIRLGWVHARKDLLEKIMEFKADGGSSPLVQMVVYEFFREDDALDLNLNRLRELLRAKRDVMLRALERSLRGAATWTTPSGGYYVWVRSVLPMDEVAVKTASARAGVEYYPGSAFYPDPVAGRDSLRLCFAHETMPRIEQGVSALGAIISSSAAASVA